MGKIDRSRRRSGCAGALRHKICTASLVNRPLIDGFVFRLDSALVGFAEQPSIPEGVMHQAGGVFHQTALRFYPGNLVNGMLERGLNRRRIRLARRRWSLSILTPFCKNLIGVPV